MKVGKAVHIVIHAIQVILTLLYSEEHYAGYIL